MIKVLHIEDRFHPGMGYQINFFARYHDPGYEFTILTSASTRLWNSSCANEELEASDRAFEEEYRITIRRRPSLLDRSGKNNLWIRGLIRGIREIAPDVLYVHALESFSALRILLSRKTLSKHALFFDTHTLLNQFQEGVKFKLYHRFLRRVAGRRIRKFHAKVFATVPENRMILEKVYGIPAEQILYSPIGTDLSLFRHDPESRKRGRQGERLEEEATLLLYTGKINSRKNPHLILEAISLVEEQILEPLHIYFIGSSEPGYRELRMQKEFSGGNIRVKQIPAVPVSELYRWYSMADFAVFPDENTLSALDAQACKLPVIMAGDMTNRERLSKGGLTYRKGDLHDLAEKILELIRNPGKRDQLGRDGETFVRETYDYRKIVKKMESDLGIVV